MSDAAPDSEILLVGGGHSHVAVLADWAKHGLPVKRATLLTPEPALRYSGMVPGWISGEHSREAGLVDLVGLARAAGVRCVLDRCIAMDPAARSVLTMSNGAMPFEIASVDVGGVGQAARILGDDPRLMDVRPIDGFVERLAQTLAQPLMRPLRMAIIGGGAAGFELAFALRNAERLKDRPQITLVTGANGALPDLSGKAARQALNEAKAQGIAIVEGDASFETGKLTSAGVSLEPCDIIVAAIGSGAPDWPRSAGLEVDKAGFIAVDQHQRSLSHPHILAAGDCAMRVDCEVPHSGVHAVHTGPVLAANLRSLAGGNAPRKSYRPRRASLYLLSTARKEAIASYGRLGAQGRWVSRLKAFIDKRWVTSYAAISTQE